MERFELIEHTADIGVRAYGVTLSEAFANAAYGLFSIIADLDKVREVESRTVSVNAGDIEGLLFEWLNEMIYLFDTECLLFKKFEITKFTDQSLEATCRGEKCAASRHQIKLGVKSATYHQMKIDRQTNTVQVIFDV